MKRTMPFKDPVDISSDESSPSDEEDETSKSKFAMLSPQEITFRKAKMYQEYMKELPVPKQRRSVVPFTSWMGLATSLKQLYGQPLHYLTNLTVRQWDRVRAGAEEESKPLDLIIHPYKAEASIWLMEEAHRLTTSSHYLSQLWNADSNYHAFVDTILPKSGV